MLRSKVNSPVSPHGPCSWMKFERSATTFRQAGLDRLYERAQWDSRSWRLEPLNLTVTLTASVTNRHGDSGVTPKLDGRCHLRRLITFALIWTTSRATDEPFLRLNNFTFRRPINFGSFRWLVIYCLTLTHCCAQFSVRAHVESALFTNTSEHIHFLLSSFLFRAV